MNAWLPSAYLAITLFLLTADHVHFEVAGVKVKLAYFLILGMWLAAPNSMNGYATQALRRVPRYAFLVAIPAAIAVATSVNVRSSIGWALWLGFDAFTVVTVYAYLQTQRFTPRQVANAVAGSIALMAAFGLVQFVSVYGFGHPLFAPQVHLGVYRLNGLSGWPHFLNIYAFLLLPIVLTAQRISAPAAVAVGCLFFVLAQSTAKTGWILLAALCCLLLVFRRGAWLRRAALIAVPLVAVALLVPMPSFPSGGEAMTGAERLARFGRNFTETTSVRDRVLINTMGIKVWLAHPWFGVGPRAYDTYVFSRFDAELPGENKLDVENRVNAKNENIWIEFLAESGVLFTLGFLACVVGALWVRRWQFANGLQLGAWMSLVLYFAISAQVSQTGLLTLVYAVFGIYFHARGMPEVEPGA